MPALWELCKDGKLVEVRAALTRGADVNNKDCDGTTALMWAVMKSHNLIVKLLFPTILPPILDVTLPIAQPLLNLNPNGN